MLNRKHNVTLTEGQISTILYVLEGYINPSEDYGYFPYHEGYVELKYNQYNNFYLKSAFVQSSEIIGYSGYRFFHNSPEGFERFTEIFERRNLVTFPIDLMF